MLYEKGIEKIAADAGTTSVQSVKSRSLRLIIMNIPTTTRAGAVAHAGTMETSGLKNMAIRKRSEVTRDARPVLPPCSTPLALSTKVVIVDVPSIAPAVVPRASAIRACLALGRCPFLSSIPALLVTPTSVPTVSKKSTKKKVNTTIQKSSEAIPEKSIFANMGLIGGGIAIRESGRDVIPSGIERAVMIRIPHSIEPLME